ncbi:MAG TPA: hypothetical protein VK586_16780 [Streptosporangiaceae bacterium]|nr:hypothetical protein [Streptosporangiaceae bacterium]
MSSAAPSPAAPSSRWRFVLTPRWLAWHAFTVAAVTGMLWLGGWQFHRAIDGNALSWAYTFEWPVFAVFGVVFWAKTILDEGKPAGAKGKAGLGGAARDRADAGLDLPGAGGPTAAAAAAGGADAEEADPDLDQYNAYLDRLNRQAQAAGRGRRPR